MLRALVVDDDQTALEFVSQALARDGWTTATSSSAAEALDLAGRSRFALAIVDVRLPDLDGFELMRRLRRECPDLAAILITGYPEVSDAVRAIHLGALTYLEKPFSRDELSRVCAVARDAAPAARGSPAGFEGMIGDSAVMRDVVRTIVTLAPLAETVLIRGETGTGKELVARALHARSGRRGRFVAVNVAAMPATLIEDQWFGHERGAFTGADAAREGVFEHARGGTLFLDEIGDLLPELQAKLLRVLESHSAPRLGSHVERPIDVRLLTATNADLEAARARGAFRPDLYYRLRQTELRLPPLRERGDDLRLFTGHYLAKIGASLGRPGLVIEPEAEAALEAYPWPGNLRELEAVLRQAVMAAPGASIGICELPADVLLPATTKPLAAMVLPKSMSLAQAVRRYAADFERRCIVMALEAHPGDVAAAAASLGLNRRTLYEKRVRYGLTSDPRS